METTNLTPPANLAAIKPYVNALAEQLKAQQVYLFAHINLQNTCNSLYSKQLNQTSYYHLLSVTEKHFIESQLTYSLASGIKKVSVSVPIICPVASNNNFIQAVLKQGFLLHGNTTANSLSPTLAASNIVDGTTQRQKWQQCAVTAKGLLTAAEQVIEEGNENICPNFLYQGITVVCKGLVQLFMELDTQRNHAKLWLALCTCFSTEPLRHFFGTPQSEAFFNTITNGYQHLKNQEAFKMTFSDAYRCLELVEDFLKLAEVMVKDCFNETMVT